MSLSKIIFEIKHELKAFFSSISMWIICLAYGVKIGKRCKFYGIMYVYKHKGAAILLGDNLIFRSSSNSNLIGINRRCSISAIRKNAIIVIGNKCGFSGTVIGAFEKIELGNNVMCGANTLITDSDWHDDDPRSGGSKPVYIGNNVWLGEGVKVLKGVSIGDNSVIGAGSVVVSNIPSNVIAAGNPCKVVKGLKPLS